MKNYNFSLIKYALLLYQMLLAATHYFSFSSFFKKKKTYSELDLGGTHL
jgi:hypothetical protein